MRSEKRRSYGIAASRPAKYKLEQLQLQLLSDPHPLPVRLYRSQGIQTQHLLGHKNQEMTDKYNDDRGLTAAEWKRLAI